MGLFGRKKNQGYLEISKEREQHIKNRDHFLKNLGPLKKVSYMDFMTDFRTILLKLDNVEIELSDIQHESVACVHTHLTSNNNFDTTTIYPIVKFFTNLNIPNVDNAKIKEISVALGMEAMGTGDSKKLPEFTALLKNYLTPPSAIENNSM